MKVEQEIEIFKLRGKRRKRVSALFNDKAVCVFINKETANGMGNIVVPRGPCTATIDGKRMPVAGSMLIGVVMDGCELDCIARVVKGLERPLIIGSTFMEEWSVVLKNGVAKLRNVPPVISESGILD